MFKYETHMHTFPVSKCARASVRDSLEFYKSLDYDGVFITNHFLDGNINIEPDIPYEQRIEFYFSDFEKAVELGKEIGIKVFFGAELSYKGTDFLVYGLDKKWYLENPQIMEMKKSSELLYLINNGALVIQAHPYREANYIDHIRLFPRNVQGVEIINSNRSDMENAMAKHYAQHYSLIEFAGSDNHIGGAATKLAGMCSNKPIISELDFVERVINGEMEVFSVEL